MFAHNLNSSPCKNIKLSGIYLLNIGLKNKSHQIATHNISEPMKAVTPKQMPKSRYDNVQHSRKLVQNAQMYVIPKCKTC